MTIIDWLLKNSSEIWVMGFAYWLLMYHKSIDVVFKAKSQTKIEINYYDL